MKRLIPFFLISAILLAGCSGAEADVPPSEAPDGPASPEEAAGVYEAAARVYDWFDLAPMTVDETDVSWENGRAYYRVAEPDCPQITTLAALAEFAGEYFSPELAASLLSLSPEQYRDFDGVLYASPGGRGTNIYLLDKTVAAERVDEDRWTVTLTFWADLESREPQADGNLHTVATVGYSQAVLDYEKMDGGWRFTSFCPSDGLDLDAETVFTINYYQDFEVTGAYRDYSDWQLACYLIHADGAYAEAPFDLLARRFLERPEDILKVLALLDTSPYGKAYGHIDGIVAGPGYAAGRFYREDKAELREILSALRPTEPAEQAALEKIRAAYESASSGGEEAPIETEFSLIVPGEKRLLTLGAQEGTFPWGYELEGTVTYTGSGDTYGTVYEVDCGDIRLAYSVSPDDGTEYLFRLSTSVRYDQAGGYFCTPRGFYCGYGLTHLREVYSHAVELETFRSDTYDACYVYEPGGDAFCRHIAFFVKDGVVTSIESEDLIDGRLLS